MTRPIPPAAIELIKLFEGLKLNSYTDLTGNRTIGYGHKCSKGDPEIVTEEQADNLLLQDAEIAATSVRYLTTAILNDNQYSALIDFVYNEGSGSYERSTLRMKLNRGDYEEVPHEFMKYVYAGPNVSLGLSRRRLKEIELFTSLS